jgi:hypothetical protein
MKNRIEVIVRNVSYKLIVLCLVAASISACGKKLSFSSSNGLQDVESSVKIKRDNNKNYAIRIKVGDLREAKSLVPPKNTYVVWIETNQGIKNMGQLLSSSGLFSKSMKASFETVTAFKPTKVFITAENEGTVQYPSGQLVLTTRSF